MLACNGNRYVVISVSNPGSVSAGFAESTRNLSELTLIGTYDCPRLPPMNALDYEAEGWHRPRYAARDVLGGSL